MKKTRISVDLQDLLDIGVYPAGVVVENRKFDEKQEASEFNPPFYRLEKTTDIRDDRGMAKVVPVDELLWPYFCARREEVTINDRLGTLLAAVLDPYDFESSLDDENWVQFIDRKKFDERVGLITKLDPGP